MAFYGGSFRENDVKRDVKASGGGVGKHRLLGTGEFANFGSDTMNTWRTRSMPIWW